MRAEARLTAPPAVAPFDAGGRIGAAKDFEDEKDETVTVDFGTGSNSPDSQVPDAVKRGRKPVYGIENARLKRDQTSKDRVRLALTGKEPPDATGKQKTIFVVIGYYPAKQGWELWKNDRQRELLRQELIHETQN